MALNHPNTGYITLISLLVTGAIGTALAVSLLLLGIGTSRTSFAMTLSNQAKALANACAEAALQRIKDSITFSGTDTLSMGGGACTYTVADLGGESRLVTVRGEIGGVIRKVTISLDRIRPQINITSWQETAD